MNILPTVACDGESALRYSSMSGLGVTAPFMSSWASFYDAATTPLQITYYDETTRTHLFLSFPFPAAPVTLFANRLSNCWSSLRSRGQFRTAPSR